MTEPKIEPRRTSDWPLAVEGWRIVGNGRTVPGFASEQSAKIAIRKNPNWQNAHIVPFDYFDGSVTGMTKYSEVRTRFAVLVRREA